MPKGQIKPKLNSETLKKLETVFSLDGTIEEACLYAGINPDTYYRWINDDEELKKEAEKKGKFEENYLLPIDIINRTKKHTEYLGLKKRFETLRNTPVLKARQEVIKGLSDNPEFSLKYLERKRKDEFSPRIEQMQDNIDNFIDDDREKAEQKLDAIVKAITKRNAKKKTTKKRKRKTK